MQSFLGSEFLDLGIAMALLFLFVSLVCTALREVIEGWSRSRARQLHLSIREVLSDRRFDGLVKQIYTHPSISALYFGPYPKAQRGRWWRRFPSYIPAANFSAALLDIVVRGDPNAAAAPAGSAPPGAVPTAISTTSVRDNLPTLKNAAVQRAILAALDFAHDDLPTARTNLENWYDAAMDRVSGVYKRRTQAILFGIGLFAAAALNIDSITIVERLSQNKALRDAVISQAESGRRVSGLIDKTLTAASDQKPPTAGTTAPPAPPPLDPALDLRMKMEAVGLPIGWDDWFQPAPVAGGAEPAAARPLTPAPSAASRVGWFPTPQSRLVRCDTLPKPPADCVKPYRYYYYIGPQAILLMGLGWLVTAFAITLGSPFWFDILNKFMVVRSTVKPHEKSRDEASKDAKPAR